MRIEDLFMYLLNEKTVKQNLIKNPSKLEIVKNEPKSTIWQVMDQL